MSISARALSIDGATRSGKHAFLAAVSGAIKIAIQSTSVSRTRFDNQLLCGKFLRARMISQLGLALSETEQVAIAAAVELFHTATLLHDDVIDGAQVRRGVASDWVRRGVTASVLTGDRFIVTSLDILHRAAPHLAGRFLSAIGQLCDAEIEHEGMLGLTDIPLECLLSIARRKTGALFAFAGFACGGDNLELALALEACGYALGLAYQYADDCCDGAVPPLDSLMKSLGSDRARGKPTLANEHRNASQRIDLELRNASGALVAWPPFAERWEGYLAEVRSETQLFIAG